jgi:hypothetical protein
MSNEQPPAICPSCENSAGWKISEEHPEACWDCRACGEHYNRNRASVYVPVGMTSEQAQQVLADSVVDQANAAAEEVIEALSVALGEVMRPYLLGKVINPDYKAEVAERQRLCRWCDPQTADDPLELGLCPAHTGNLLDENKKHVETAEEALSLLWAFVDEISQEPREGNVFDRAAIMLERLREMQR